VAWVAQSYQIAQAVSKIGSNRYVNYVMDFRSCSAANFAGRIVDFAALANRVLG